MEFSGSGRGRRGAEPTHAAPSGRAGNGRTLGRPRSPAPRPKPTWGLRPPSPEARPRPRNSSLEAHLGPEPSPRRPGPRVLSRDTGASTSPASCRLPSLPIVGDGNGHTVASGVGRGELRPGPPGVCGPGSLVQIWTPTRRGPWCLSSHHPLPGVRLQHPLPRLGTPKIHDSSTDRPTDIHGRMRITQLPELTPAPRTTPGVHAAPLPDAPPFPSPPAASPHLGTNLGSTCVSPSLLRPWGLLG